MKFEYGSSSAQHCIIYGRISETIYTNVLLWVFKHKRTTLRDFYRMKSYAWTILKVGLVNFQKIFMFTCPPVNSPTSIHFKVNVCLWNAFKMSAYLPVKQSADQLHMNVETFFSRFLQCAKLSTCPYVHMSTCPPVYLSTKYMQKSKSCFYNIFIALVCLHVDQKRLYVF